MGLLLPVCRTWHLPLHIIESCLRNKTAAFQQPHFVVDIVSNQQQVRCEDTSLPFGGIGDIWFKVGAEEVHSRNTYGTRT